MASYKVYCLSFQNNERKMLMKTKLDTLGIDYTFYDGVALNDKRIFNNLNINYESNKRLWSIMYSHLDMIQMFYNNENIDYGIFCEDDIYIHKDFKELIPGIIKDFQALNLDVLLLGYLVTFKIEEWQCKFLLKNKNYQSNFKYHNFPEKIWGAHGYMLSKENAKKILEKYDESSFYAIKTLLDTSLTPFSPDWTITKDGNRALIMPCLVVENAYLTYKPHNIPDDEFHKACCEVQYDSNIFI